MSSVPPAVPMTDLEGRLASCEGPALREYYRVQLSALAVNARAQLGRGLAPADYQAYAALAEAAETAQAVLAEYPLSEPILAPANFAVHAFAGDTQVSLTPKP